MAFELLQKVEMPARERLLRRFAVGRAKVLSDCSSDGHRLVRGTHVDQCLESDIVPRSRAAG
jgi:hypothetical protein